MSNFTLAIHGGAGTIAKGMLTPEKEAIYLQGLRDALDAGNAVLSKGGAALDAVEQAVISLENNTLFNAGKGAVFNHEEKHEMDASIMDGRNLAAGAVTCVRNIKNPISTARIVMEQSEHVLLSGEGAEVFAKLHNVAFEADSYFYDEFRHEQWLALKDTESFELDHSKSEKKFGTVGAVAMDINGNLAAATSTGGMTNKKWGRIGDTPVIGAGTYANNNSCAVSCTGHGELFLRSVVAYDISCLMEYKGLSLQEACDIVVMDKLVKIGGEGGIIALDKLGNIAMPFNSEGMYRGSSKNGQSNVFIYR